MGAVGAGRGDEVPLVVLARCRVGPGGLAVFDGSVARVNLNAEVADGEVDGHTTYESFLFQNPQDYIDKLSQDYHINALQYYDWQYRHEQPVATGDLENEWPLWYQNNYASKKTITDYITDAKRANMGSLAYSMAYAANDGYDSSRIPDE